VWCDTFDADLLKLVPGAVEALGRVADVQLLTYYRELTDGRINHPCAWHTDYGLAAFFWTAPEGQPTAFFSTRASVAECTFLEAVRDEWAHSCLIVVDRNIIWNPPSRLMTRLMDDVRGWRPLDAEQREQDRDDVLASLRQAAAKLTAVIAR
jgi:hypothetical protein